MSDDGPVPARVTLQTIADRVGVSRTTVSNAYNRPDQLGEDVRERIFAAAEELGYRGPDVAARMLRTGHMGAIGLLFTEDLRFVFTDPDTTHFMQGVAETSALAGTALTLVPVPVGMDLSETAVFSAAVDGYLVFSVADDHPALTAISSRDVPVVIVDEPDLGDTTSFVGIDDRRGAMLAAQHLVSLGHTNVGVLLGRATGRQQAGELDLEGASEATVRIVRDRVAGYREGFGEAADLIVWEAGAMDPDAGRNAAQAMLEANPHMTALACFSDQLAIGAAQAGERLGRSIPRDLSIVGFDDAPRARTWDPPLTTIRQPMVDKGRIAAELLLEQIGGAAPRRVELPIDLVVRSSTAPPR